MIVSQWRRDFGHDALGRWQERLGSILGRTASAAGTTGGDCGAAKTFRFSGWAHHCPSSLASRERCSFLLDDIELTENELNLFS